MNFRRKDATTLKKELISRFDSLQSPNDAIQVTCEPLRLNNSHGG